MPSCSQAMTGDIIHFNLMRHDDHVTPIKQKLNKMSGLAFFVLQLVLDHSIIEFSMFCIITQLKPLKKQSCTAS